jgi:hypothetical protein
MATADQTRPTTSGLPAPPVRKILTLLGAVLVVGLIIAGGFTLIDVAARHSFDVRASYAGVQSLVIDDGGGDVVLTSAAAGSRLTIAEHVTRGLVSPRRAAAFAGGVLRLTTDCRGFDPECRVRYAVAVPAGTPVTAGSGAGSVTASGLHSAGIVHLSSGAGDVIATDVSSATAVALSSGAGDVTATRVGAPRLRLSSGAGDVAADVTTLIGTLVAHSGAGDVSLSVPDSSYALQASSGAGDVSDSSLRTDPASRRTISATSGAGDVTLTPHA